MPEQPACDCVAAIVVPVVLVVQVKFVLTVNVIAPKQLLFIGAAAIPVPCKAKSYGFSLLSSFIKEIVALSKPTNVGVKVTTNVVLEPIATVALGEVVTEKSPAFVPVNEMAPIFKIAVPVFCIVNVLVIPTPTVVLPKSVQSVNEGVISPSTIEVALP